MSAMHKVVKTARFMLALKGAVGFAFIALALFGVAVPHFGFEPTVAQEGAAATLGGLVGALVGLRA